MYGTHCPRLSLLSFRALLRVRNCQPLVRASHGMDRRFFPESGKDLKMEERIPMVSGSEVLSNLAASPSESATALLPGQDNSAPSTPTSAALCSVVSCGF